MFEQNYGEVCANKSASIFCLDFIIAMYSVIVLTELQVTCCSSEVEFH